MSIRRLRGPDAALAAVLALLLAAPAGAEEDCVPAHAVEDPAPVLGLMGTIPIYWGEAGGVGDVLSGEAQPHWARATLEDRFTLRPLDRLDRESLAGLSYLLLAQPRAFSPAENVALDRWVREGGRLLLFADPLMTGESRFPIGDRRRPQDVILLSPILDHWGLELFFAENQPAGSRMVESAGPQIPVRLAGHFAAQNGDCRLESADVLARCEIGDGAGIVLADAALLDFYGENLGARQALTWLVDQAFPASGKFTGRDGMRAGLPDNQEKSDICMVNSDALPEGGPSG
ncbi:hypothetical protein FHS61_000165 [Altererythrobacter atlanticus]|uniref:ABC-type uncharacterized transport system n=1 Tax=Croceibacterium atlanticum TaxID=1267766 RepID=A0A0F7KUE7_9SPHN|nr:hypothetical protein [Croceibacterium atlanticum]AKH42395.1 ABC-type uncharacterized transport system [Croceibacterium atlanticum]MBB5731172.1 hypothetical protein [Croceibacterium atlanticum]